MALKDLGLKYKRCGNLYDPKTKGAPKFSKLTKISATTYRIDVLNKEYYLATKEVKGWLLTEYDSKGCTKGSWIFDTIKQVRVWVHLNIRV